MKYYLAIDGGGTKVAAALYDDDFKKRGVCVTGSVRPNTTSTKLIRKHTRDIIEKLDLCGKTLEEFAGTCEREVLDEVGKVCTIKKVVELGELDLGLSAAGIFGDGLLALCGTGATVYARYKGKKLFVGGYGAAISDEGSGYYVGRTAFIAAIHDAEGRGEHTILTDMIPQRFGFEGREQLSDALFSIYRKSDVSPIACVAGLAPTVVAAAEQNDEVAVNILTEAGKLLGEQTCYLIRSRNLSNDLPMTISGSMWRRNPILFGEFLRVVKAQCEERTVIIPRLEPILGAAAYNIYKSKGEFKDADAEALLSEFPEFGYDINENKTSKGDK